MPAVTRPMFEKPLCDFRFFFRERAILDSFFRGEHQFVSPLRGLGLTWFGYPRFRFAAPGATNMPLPRSLELFIHHMKQHIEEALQKIRLSSLRYARAERYYRGEHDLAFASEKFENTFGTLFREFAMNLCPAVCDAVKDKLIVRGFTVETVGEGASVDDAHGRTRETWRRNRMQVRAGEIHKEAVTTGDAYAFVWPDEGGRPVIYPNRAASCAVEYDAERPGLITRAAKIWHSADGRVRVNLFYPDRIEKYVSSKTANSIPEASDFAAFGGDGPHVVPNPYGIVPVFHFANNGEVGAGGRSELEAVIPIQDGLNKSVLDMLVAMEFSAYRQRWAAGIEIEYDHETGKPIAPFKAGVDHLWISQNPEAKFGDFNTAELEQFLKVKDSFRIDIASVTGTPLHYLMPFTEGFRSGEAFRKAEARFISKVRSRQQEFGQVWADVMSFALRVSGVDASVAVQWEDAAPLSEKERLELILLKKEIGISEEQALSEAGYGGADASDLSMLEDPARP